MGAKSNHGAVVQASAHSLRAQGKRVDKRMVPCCAPRKLRPLTMIYKVSHNKILQKTLNDMVLVSCGC